MVMKPAADMIVTRDTPYADVELETTYDYNPDKANQLLDEAGWVMNESTGIREKDGEPLNLLLTLESDYSATSMPTAEVIKSQLAEVGIDVTIYGTEQMQWYADYLEGKFDLTCGTVSLLLLRPTAGLPPWTVWCRRPLPARH